MQFETLNITALEKAVALLFGEAATPLVTRTYHTINEAMMEGYDQGRADAEDDQAETVDAFFDRLGADEIVFSLQHDSGDEQPDQDGYTIGG